jgi:glucose-1-phosphate cytidylyltransferase
MQVVILCGGYGTRLRDVSEHLPKPMVPVGGRPILWHIMKGFAAHGLNRFVLCLGYQSHVIKKYFLDYRLTRSDFTVDLGDPAAVEFHGGVPAEDWRVTLAETGDDAQTGCRLKRVEKYLDGDEFLLTYGDGVGDVDVTSLIEFHREHGRIGTVTAVRPPGRFGEIETTDGRVTEFNEKPHVSRGRINGGFFVFRRDFLDRLDDDPRLVLEQEPLIRLARDGELMAFPHDGFWQPMDTARDHQTLNDLWARDAAPWKTWDRPVELVPVGAGAVEATAAKPKRPRKSR